MLHVTIGENLRFLSQQGVAIRGDGNESDSNFHQLLLILSADNPELAQYESRNSKRSPESYGHIALKLDCRNSQELQALCPNGR